MDFNDLPIKEKDFLICEQNKGKDIKYIDNKWVAVDHVVSDEEKKQARMGEIRARLNELSQDFLQATVGAQIDDISSRILEFRALHNELRGLQGKAPRSYK